MRLFSVVLIRDFSQGSTSLKLAIVSGSPLLITGLSSKPQWKGRAMLLVKMQSYLGCRK